MDENVELMSQERDTKQIISFSQLSMYNQCQYKWYLSYAKNLRTRKGNIHLVFGSAMHEVLQSYLDTMFKVSVKNADCLDLNALLLESMKKNFASTMEKSGEMPCTQAELVEFYNDGIAILDFFKKHRQDYFSNKGYELVGIEIPLKVEMKNKKMWFSFLDLVIRDTVSGKIKIYDFKTSTKGWKDYKKKDENTISQLVLYKKFYSDLCNVPVDLIEVEFIILKRKLYENVDFPQKRIQRFAPAAGSISMKKFYSGLENFINDCFDETGQPNLTKEYSKNPTKLCEWCDMYNIHCNGKK